MVGFQGTYNSVTIYATEVVGFQNTQITAYNQLRYRNGRVSGDLNNSVTNCATEMVGFQETYNSVTNYATELVPFQET